MLVVGDRESTEGTVSVRTRAGGDQGASRIEAFLMSAQEEIRLKNRPSECASASGAGAEAHAM
jgi:threonyl-tRNA synthetase